jgi:hypothetical protein
MQARESKKKSLELTARQLAALATSTESTESTQSD